MTGPPTDEEVLAALERSLAGHTVVSLSRRPYRYATSFPLEEVRVQLDGGQERALILKDLAADRLLGDARAGKPEFLYEAAREHDTYRRVLAPAGLGARWYGSGGDPATERRWFLVEKVPGVELWQVGDLAVWEAVAAWLARFHARFASRVAELRETNPALLVLDGGWFEVWRDRARAALRASTDERAGALLDRLGRYDGVVASLAALPHTFVHGEFYPSNVLVAVGEGDVRVWPVDWEMAGTGPAVLDLAALVGGWPDEDAARLVAAYRAAGGVAGDRELDGARLHLALQWLGWSSGWEAPPEHAHDWLDEALGLAERLQL